MPVQVEVYDRPLLHEPVLLAGFTGWLDGGEASTGTMKYLVEKLKATRFASLPAEEFHVYQVPGVESLRPHVQHQEGVVAEERYPSNDFYAWHRSDPSEGPDLIILVGSEPSLRWRQYLDAVLELAESFGVRRVYSTGGVLDRSPHTREPIVSCGLSHEELRELMRSYAVRFSNYEGPSTFCSALVHASAQRSLQAIHFSARCTFYPEFSISIPHNPKAIRSIMQRLNHLIPLRLNLEDLDDSARKMEERLNAVVAETPKLAQYLRELETNYVELRYQEPIEGSAEDFVRGIEAFLRREREGETG